MSSLPEKMSAKQLDFIFCIGNYTIRHFFRSSIKTVHKNHTQLYGFYLQHFYICMTLDLSQIHNKNCFLLLWKISVLSCNKKPHYSLNLKWNSWYQLVIITTGHFSQTDYLSVFLSFLLSFKMKYYEYLAIITVLYLQSKWNL